MRSRLPSYPTPDDVEQSFYEALQAGRIDELMACWTDEDEPVCVQPAGPRLVGLKSIRASFAGMFAHGPITVQPEVVHRSLHGDCAIHSVIETVVVSGDEGLLEAALLATNVYVLTASGWRLALHHASSGGAKPLDPVAGVRPHQLH
jgi:ketosteroid isomerase-like protein